MFEEDDTEVIVHDNVNSDLVDDFDQSDDTQTDDADSPSVAPPPFVGVSVDEQADVVDLYGNCLTWTNGAVKEATNQSFDELQEAADAVSLTVDEYCSTLVTPPLVDVTTTTERKPSKEKPAATKPAATPDDAATDDEATDAPPVDEPSDDATDDGETDDDSDDTGNGGNGNGGNGNGGNGNGNGNGHGNGNGNGNNRGKDKGK